MIGKAITCLFFFEQFYGWSVNTSGSVLTGYEPVSIQYSYSRDHIWSICLELFLMPVTGSDSDFFSLDEFKWFFMVQSRERVQESHSLREETALWSLFTAIKQSSHFTCLLAFKTNAQVSRSERDSRRAVALIALLSTGDSTINSMKVPCNSFNVGCGENASFPTLLSNEAGKNKTHLISKTVTEMKQQKHCHHKWPDTHDLW